MMVKLAFKKLYSNNKPAFRNINSILSEREGGGEACNGIYHIICV
jgi:hypothetical protein